MASPIADCDSNSSRNARKKKSSSELWVAQRNGVGRYVFPEPLPSSTTLGDISEIMNPEFGLKRKWLAHFRIFPQYYMDNGSFPDWHDRSLPWDIMLDRATMLDYDAISAGQFVEISDRYAPILHLVL